jgi:hypothetical protein
MSRVGGRRPRASNDAPAGPRDDAGEHGAPPLPVDELGDVGGELLVQRLELLESVLVSSCSLLAGQRSAAFAP